MTRPLTARGHVHVEAFCLMRYSCGCSHSEIIWNSRDGVTPFTAPCPSCGSPIGLTHVNFQADGYAPDHHPHKGQRVWVDMTEDRATSLALAHIVRVKKQFGMDYSNRLPSLIADFLRGGEAPDLRVQGIDYHHPEA